MSRWVVAVFLFFGITVCESLCLADCVPGESGGRWVEQSEMNYRCTPVLGECSTWVGGLVGTSSIGEEISGNIKKSYYNCNNPCSASFEDRCPYLGGPKPLPQNNWGNPVIWTYYMWTYFWVCDDDQCPNDANKTEPGICGCGMPDIDSDGDGAPECIDNINNGPTC